MGLPLTPQCSPLSPLPEVGMKGGGGSEMCKLRGDVVQHLKCHHENILGMNLHAEAPKNADVCARLCVEIEVWLN